MYPSFKVTNQFYIPLLYLINHPCRHQIANGYLFLNTLAHWTAKQISRFYRSIFLSLLYPNLYLPCSHSGSSFYFIKLFFFSFQLLISQVCQDRNLFYLEILQFEISYLISQFLNVAIPKTKNHYFFCLSMEIFP